MVVIGQSLQWFPVTLMDTGALLEMSIQRLTKPAKEPDAAVKKR